MFNNGIGLADIAAVSGRNNDGFGGNNGWWILIILLAMFGGFGNGWGNGGNGNTTAIDASLQRGFDNQSVMNSLRGIENGICSLGYDQLAQMNGINTNVMQSAFGLQNSINGLSAQLASCCCDTREAIGQVRYDMAANTCAITNTMNQGFSQLDRTINDKFCELEMRQMKQTIDEQQSLIQSLNNSISQANQSRYLISELRPSPVPAYPASGAFPNGYFGNWGNWNNCNNNCCGNSCCNS